MLAAPHCLRSFDECQNCRSRRDAQAIMPPVSSSRTPTAAETDRLEAKTAVLETADGGIAPIAQCAPVIRRYCSAGRLADRTSFYLCLPLSCHDLSSVCLVASHPLRPFVN